MKNQEIPVVNYDKPFLITEKDLEDIRLNKIERPKLMRQSARYHSDEDLKMLYMSKGYQKDYLKQNENNKKETLNFKIKQNS